MGLYETTVMAEFGQKVCDIFKEHETWANADEHMEEIYKEIADLASQTDVSMN